MRKLEAAFAKLWETHLGVDYKFRGYLAATAETENPETEERLCAARCARLSASQMPHFSVLLADIISFLSGSRTDGLGCNWKRLAEFSTMRFKRSN
jgi:hypothetical protein